MSCSRMEHKILGYVDGRLKESERLEVEKHLAACAACRLRVNEFRAADGIAGAGSGRRWRAAEPAADVRCNETATPIRRMAGRDGNQRGDGAAVCGAEARCE